jgi:peptidoglycan/LPS O-acetylase OafA/YrhL
MARAEPPRQPELSLANLIFCGMVLLLHICSDTIADAPTDTPFYLAVFTLWRLSSAAVYGFFFLSGLKAMLGPRRPLGAYYLRRARAILPAYLVWSLLYYLVRLVLGRAAFSLPELLRGLLQGDCAAHLYFIIALLQFYLLIPLWRAMVDRLPAAVVLPALALLSGFLPDAMADLWQRYLPQVPPYLDRLFLSYLFVWCAGCYAGAGYERFSQALRQGRRFLWIGAALLAVPYVWCNYQNQAHAQWYVFLTPLHQLWCMMAAGASLALAQSCAGVMRHRPLQAWDRASYQIYLGHLLPLLAAPALMRRLRVPPLAGVQLPLRALLVLVPTLGLSLLWQHLRTRRQERRART